MNTIRTRLALPIALAAALAWSCASAQDSERPPSLVDLPKSVQVERAERVGVSMAMLYRVRGSHEFAQTEVQCWAGVAQRPDTSDALTCSILTFANGLIEVGKAKASRKPLPKELSPQAQRDHLMAKLRASGLPAQDQAKVFEALGNMAPTIAQAMAMAGV